VYGQNIPRRGELLVDFQERARDLGMRLRISEPIEAYSVALCQKVLQLRRHRRCRVTGR